MQGRGRIGSLDLQTPAMIRFGENTTDEVFITHEAATAGVEVENTGTEPLVGLRYFGPDTHGNSAQRRAADQRVEHTLTISRPTQHHSNPFDNAMSDHPNNFPKLHNAAWPGVVGKGGETTNRRSTLDTMLDLTAAAEVDGRKFDGVDLFLFDPHVSIDATDDELEDLADRVRSRGLVIGSRGRPGVAADRWRIGRWGRANRSKRS